MNTKASDLRAIRAQLRALQARVNALQMGRDRIEEGLIVAHASHIIAQYQLEALVRSLARFGLA